MVLQLFEGEKIRLAALDLDKDAPVMSKWTHDPEFLRMLDTDPARPLSPFHVKKRLEEMEKEAGHDWYYFTIRTREDDRLVGSIHLRWVEWNHGNGHFNMGIGSPDDRGKGYGREALQMLMRYAFEELNLYRLTGHTMEYNDRAQRFLERNGWQLEVRRREAIYREGRYWDAVSYGILATEWAAQADQAGAIQASSISQTASSTLPSPVAGQGNGSGEAAAKPDVVPTSESSVP